MTRTPFFMRFVEKQDNDKDAEVRTEIRGGKGFVTLKYPSDRDEYQTMKYPSDDDEGGSPI